jgi:sugar phosphate isomerase/epimerase
MKNFKESKGGISRRKFLGSTAAAAALSMVPLSNPLRAGIAAAPAPAGDKPNSNFGGVQIGAITYSWRSMPGGVENIIKYCTESGISSIELMSNDLEESLGAPKNPMMSFFSAPPAPPRPAAPAAGAVPAAQPQAPAQAAAPAGQTPPAGGFRRPELTAEQKAALEKYNQDIRAWRLALPMSKVEEARKLFNDAGINIHIVKFSPARWSDEEIDYAFRAAKAMGAKGVTEEIGEEAVKKLAPFAEKHGMFAIFHNHMQFATPGFGYDKFIAISPAVRFNFDAGHFFGSTGLHPNTIIEKYHDRIFSLHIKDKTGPKTDPPNENQVWGQGEMPLADVLNLIKTQKWPIYCDIELEYDVKPWSNAVKETGTCVRYAKQILVCP